MMLISTLNSIWTFEFHQLKNLALNSFKIYHRKKLIAFLICSAIISSLFYNRFIHYTNSMIVLISHIYAVTQININKMLIKKNAVFIFYGGISHSMI